MNLVEDSHALDTNTNLGQSKTRFNLTRQPIRILYLNQTAKVSGGEVALLNLVTNLDRSRYEPSVLLFTNGPLVEKLRRCGIVTTVVDLDDGVLSVRKEQLGLGSLIQIKKILSILKFVARVSASIRESRADIVHCNSLKADLIGGVAARVANVPVIWHVRDRIVSDYLPTPVVKAFKFLSRVIPTHVIAISNSTRNSLGFAECDSKQSVIWDGTNLASSLNKNVNSNSDALIVALVGRISPWKGQDVFVRAAAKAIAKFPQAKFWIVGSAMFGEESFEASVRSLVAKLSLENSVIFKGFTDDVKSVYTEADVVVHASTIGEPFGQVIIEAMSAGVTVVATAGGGVPEILEGSNAGLMVEMNDVDAMAAAIEKLLGNPEMRRQMGENGRLRVEAAFDIKLTAAKVQTTYDKLVRARK